ncbi:alpha/beta fold hydrolase [Altererythrobacter salegens]|uniref:Alpha/beta fold hydrolase n=1 Tax=Croceibacterium salegens TaxID=1737568 RepID=A0A6I4STX1_9SPHN|nr:alpha/beta hydrolase [Croceibacterium salegens]MXO58346.1 alpha/beta fold hydrolase [Croceibacterium salegens]
MAQPVWQDDEWESADGLKLHYRDYPGGEGKPPLLCLHGLTRNARDFAPLAERFAGEWRMIVPEMRGRGDSEYGRDGSSYNLPTYVDDVVRLLQQLDVGSVAVVGTSMGGLMAMFIAQAKAWPLAGVALNDIGPDLEPEGVARIREYVGQGGSYETWMHAARALRESNGSAHPTFGLSEWIAFAKQLMCISGNGRITFDYDMRVAESLQNNDAGIGLDLWPAYRSLAGMPLLVLRGELSDLISQATVEAMQGEVLGAKAVTVPGVGHPPLLGEPAAQEAIAAWLADIA